MIRNRFFLVLCSCLPFYFACAPKLQHNTVSTKLIRTEPKLQDTKLNIQAVDLQNLTEFKYTFPSRHYLNLSENLLRFGAEDKNSIWYQSGLQLKKSFYQGQSTTTPLQIENAPYINQALADYGPEAINKLTNFINIMDEQWPQIIDLLESSEQTFEWKKNTKLIEVPKEIHRFVVEEVEVLNQQQINSTLISEIKKYINSQFQEKSDNCQKILNQILISENLTDIMIKLQNVIQVLGSPVPENIKPDLLLGIRLGNQINAVQSPQDALTIIIEFWRRMTHEEKIKYLKKESSELYTFLSEQNDYDLNCLSSENCWSIIKIFEKKKIFQELNNIGIANLRRKFNSGASQYVKNKLQSMVPSFFETIPQLFNEQFRIAYEDKRQELLFIKNNFSDYAFTIIKNWATHKLTENKEFKLIGIENAEIEVNFSNKKLSIAGTKSHDDSFYTGAGTIGSSLALLSSFWQTDQHESETGTTEDIKNIRTVVFENINKMLAILGYKNWNQSISGTYLLPIKKHFDYLPRIFNFFDSNTNPEINAVPDRIPIINSYTIDPNINSSTSSISEQAELLRGVSLLIPSFKDWEPTAFDSDLGEIKLKDLNIEILPDSLKDLKIFPKSSIFALAVGNALSIIQNLKKENTPIFAINTENKIVWLNEIENSTGINGQSQPTHPFAMAGIVSLKDQKRSTSVITSDVAQYLFSLCLFYQSILGIEQTHATQLLIEKNGSKPIDEIIKAQAKIKNLIMGMANFLSHQMQNNNGLMNHQYDLNTGEFIHSAVPRLNDQLLTLKALIKTSEILNTQIYRGSILDIYYSMNQNMWNTQFAFYDDGMIPMKQSVLVRFEHLDTLAKLKPLLNYESQQQLELITENMKPILQTLLFQR